MAINLYNVLTKIHINVIMHTFVNNRLRENVKKLEINRAVILQCIEVLALLLCKLPCTT